MKIVTLYARIPKNKSFRTFGEPLGVHNPNKIRRDIVVRRLLKEQYPDYVLRDPQVSIRQKKLGPGYYRFRVIVVPRQKGFNWKTRG